MKDEEIRKTIHDLTNKLAILDGKLNKAHRICQQEDVIIELEKGIKNSKLSLELLGQLKRLINEE